MTKYCRNCGKELDEDSVFCMSCGTKVAGSANTSSTMDNINESFSKLNDSIDKVSNDFTDSISDLVDIYKINMMDDEVVIKHSQIHPGCLYARYLLLE